MFVFNTLILIKVQIITKGENILEKSNAVRFIDAYNKIDYQLRIQYNFKRSMSFSDMIRKAVVMNHIVRKYEDDLIDFGRLRNAIIHKSNDKFLIAEPHTDVVEKLEKITKRTQKSHKKTIEKRKKVCYSFNVKIWIGGHKN